MKYHFLKTKVAPFTSTAIETKTAELRFGGDRDFNVGDRLILLEIDAAGILTGRAAIRQITHIETVSDWIQGGHAGGWVVLSHSIPAFLDPVGDLEALEKP